MTQSLVGCLVVKSYKCRNINVRPVSCWVHVNCLNYYSLLGPNFSRTLLPFSSYSAFVIQNSSLSFMTSARTAPPMNTMSFLLGGSSILILNLASLSVSPFKTRSRCNCLISLSSLLGSPGYIVEPPDKTRIQELIKAPPTLISVIYSYTDVFVELGSDVNVPCLDGAEHELGHALALLVDKMGLEQSLTRLKPFSTHLDNMLHDKLKRR